LSKKLQQCEKWHLALLGEARFNWDALGEQGEWVGIPNSSFLIHNSRVMRILHALSQRPSLTGSGITLEAMVRHAAEAGHEQRVVVGVPVDDPRPAVGGLDPDQISPLAFGRSPLDFAVPGMSDVMPYPSTRFSDLTKDQVTVYCRAWADHLRSVLSEFEPDVIHSHHLWLMSAVLKDVAPTIPVLTQCHATGIRQMALCPHLADQVRKGCSRIDAFAVLHRGHAGELERCLGISGDRIHQVGAGYREDLFFAPATAPEPALLYIGKYSAAKGLPWLLDAFAGLSARRPELTLHIAGGGSGKEADDLRARMDRMAPAVVQHGQLSQPALADVARCSTVCVLPSFYEGLPLVLVEALACGCRLVATGLPGITEELAPRLGGALTVVETPRLETIDQPHPDDLPAFVDRLETALENALDAPPIGSPARTMPGALAHFSWGAVYARVEAVWNSLI
jgi:glycosyltransferase involved in cell wall biosynthesis